MLIVANRIRGPTIVADSRGNGARTSRTSSRDESRTYYVDSSEGQWATIQISTRHPVRERYKTDRGTIAERVIYKGVSAGFRILPLIENNILTLKVKAIHEAAQIDTVLSGPLNTWLNLGGIVTGRETPNSVSTADRNGLRSHMAIKVELVDTKNPQETSPR